MFITKKDLHIISNTENILLFNLSAIADKNKHGMRLNLNMRNLRNYTELYFI